MWCLAVSPSGDYIVSSSHDKSLRLWERTREPIILEEEKEMVGLAASSAVLFFNRHRAWLTETFQHVQN